MSGACAVRSESYKRYDKVMTRVAKCMSNIDQTVYKTHLQIDKYVGCARVGGACMRHGTAMATCEEGQSDECCDD